MYLIHSITARFSFSEKTQFLPVLSIDTNIVLDNWLEREPFFADAKALFQAIESGEIEGFITATSVTDIFYISRKSKDPVDSKAYISELLTFVEICTVDIAILQAAVVSELSDLVVG